MSTIREDDFSSGDALSVSYDDITNAETNATCGRDGGWGCRTTGTASQQHYGYFIYIPATPLDVNYVRASFDADRSAFLAGEVGAWLLALFDSAGNTEVELTHGDDDDNTKLVVNSYWLGAALESATGAVTPGTWQTAVLEVWFSTHTLNGGFYDANADGRIKVSVDGVAVVDEAAIQVGGGYAVVNGTNRVYAVAFGPSGNGDNVGLYTDTGEVWVDIPNWHAHEYLDAAQYPGGAARVLCDLWTEDTGASPLPTITARLVSLLADGETIDAEVGRSATISATDPTDATFSVTLAGRKQHKLQVTSDTAGVDLFCAPGAKVTP